MSSTTSPSATIKISSYCGSLPTIRRDGGASFLRSWSASSFVSTTCIKIKLQKRVVIDNLLSLFLD